MTRMDVVQRHGLAVRFRNGTSAESKALMLQQLLRGYHIIQVYDHLYGNREEGRVPARWHPPA